MMQEKIKITTPEAPNQQSGRRVCVQTAFTSILGREVITCGVKAGGANSHKAQ